MVDYVARQITTFDNGVSAGAAAAASDLEKLAAAGERVDASVTKVGRSAASLKNQLDPVARATRDLATAKKTLADAEARLSDDMARGTTTQAEYDRAIATATANVEKKRAVLAAAKQATAELADITQRSAADMRNAAQVAERYATSLSNLRAKYDPLYSAERQHARALEDIATAEQLGALSAQQAAAARVQQTQAYAALQREVSGLAALERQQAAAERDAARAAKELATEVDSLRAKYSPLYAASKQYETTLEEIARAERLGAVSTQQAALAREQARVAMAGMGAPTEATTGKLRLQSHEWTNLSYQLQDFVVQVGSGQGVFRPLLQQAPQATGAVGGVSRAWQLLRQELTVSRVVIGGAALALGTMGIAAEVSERRLNTLQNRLQATRDDYKAMANEARAAAGQFATDSHFSFGDSFDSSRIIASAREFRGTRADIMALQGVAADLATTLSVTLPEAAGTLAKALSDPAAAVRELAEKDLRGFNAGLVRQVELMQAAGDKAGAYAKVLEAVARATAGAAANRSDLQKAITDIGNSFEEAWRTMQPFAELIIGKLAEVFRMANDLDRRAMNNPLVRMLGDAAGVDLNPNRSDTPTTPRASYGPAAPDSRTRINEAMGRVSQINPRLYRQQENRAQAAGLQEALRQPGITPAETQAIRAALGELAEQYAGMEGPMSGFLRGLRNQATAAKEMEGAARELKQAEIEANEVARSAGQGHAGAAAVAQARALVQERLNSQLTDYIIRLELAADADNAEAAAMAGGARAAAEARDAFTAQTEALKYGVAGSTEYERASDRITDSLRNQREAAEKLRNEVALLNQRQQMEVLETEGRLISANADARERELAALRERQKIESEKGDPESEAGRQRIANAQRIADTTRQNTLMQNSWDELARIGEQAFDRIGSAITEAFANGSMQALDFGAIAKAVISEVIQAALKMAVINPLLNGMFGGTRATVGGVTAALAKSGGASAVAEPGASGGMLDGLSGIGKLFRGGDGAINTGFSWLDSNLNATAYSVGGADISVAGAGAGALGVAGGLYGMYSGFQTGGAKGWAQGIGGAASTIAGISTLAGIGGTSAAAAGTAAGGLAALSAVPTVGATVAAGAGAGAAGAGAAAAGAAGAGSAILGAVAAVAPYIAVIAAVAALFLPGQKPSDMTGVYLGNLASGESSVTGLGGDRYSQENRDQATAIGQQVAALGTSLKAALGVDLLPFNYSVSLGARDGLVAGYNNTTKHYSADEPGSQRMIADITTAMIESMRGLASAEVQSIIARSGGNTETLLGNLDWYNGTYKTMIAESENPVTQWERSITALTAPIDAAITKARELGLSEDKLSEVRAKGIQTLVEQRTATLDAIALGDRQRQALAGGTNPVQLQLAGFHEAALSEVKALEEQLKQLGLNSAERDPFLAQRWASLSSELGAMQFQAASASNDNRNGLIDRIQAARGASDTVGGALWDYDRKALAEFQKAQRDGITDLTLLAEAQAAERLGIEKRFAEQATALDQQQRESAQQSVMGVVNSLTEYARSLRYGESSSLSYRQQYSLAGADIRNTAASALSGDWSSIQQVQALSQTFLSASQAVNGSGAQYAADRAWVQDLLAGIAGMGADRLTESARLAASVDNMKNDLSRLLQEQINILRSTLLEIRQTNTKPARAAA